MKKIFILFLVFISILNRALSFEKNLESETFGSLDSFQIFDNEPEKIESSPLIQHPVYKWINQQDTVKSKFAWINAEDVIYHELRIDNHNWQTAPEFYALMNQNWVFNRKMQWIRSNDNIIAYCSDGNLHLTGEKQCSRWFSDPQNSISEEGEYTIFTKRSKIRIRDAVVLPTFQFHLGQHPIAELEVTDANRYWQFNISIKGRSGDPIYSSGWKNGKSLNRINLKELLEKAGYGLNYAELHFAMSVFANSPSDSAKVKFKLNLNAANAIISCLPVIKTVQNASNGVDISAIVIDKSGFPLKDNRIGVKAFLNGKIFDLTLQDSIWKTKVFIDKPGDYSVEFKTTCEYKLITKQALRITDGVFYNFDKQTSMLSKAGKCVSPLTGSYQGAFYFKGGLDHEKLVQGQKQWDEWDKKDEHTHWWESLTEKELDERFGFLNKNGWNLTHLNQHWGIWERLDAGGNIAPHGAEQLALYIRSLAANGLAHIQDLSHYPYVIKTKSWNGTNVWQQYIDAGFKDDQWFKPDQTNFDKLFRQYIADFASLFANETSIFAISASGEGDYANGLPRTNDIISTLKERDINHLTIGEAVHIYKKIPPECYENWNQDILGSRTYILGSEVDIQKDLGIYFKLNNLQKNAFMAESAFPATNKYSKMFVDSTKDEHISWVGTEMYRNHVRDNLYLGFIHKQMALMTWDEEFTEDEHLVLNQVKSLIDYSKPIKQPELAVLINDSIFTSKGRKVAAEIESYFTTSFPIPYRYVVSDEQSKGFAYVLDIREPAKFDLSKLEEARQLTQNLKVSEGYAVSYNFSEDKEYFIAYVYNVTKMVKYNVFYCKTHRMPNPVDLKIDFMGNMNDYKLKIYDLNNKKLLTESKTSIPFIQNNTRNDYLIIGLKQNK